ncbi:MAG: hypothetical protein GAK41_00734 [Burkholderia gladioli]|nr:MAG: hypothetical protein GAK41_00734 [Burkholderia gladioli]
MLVRPVATTRAFSSTGLPTRIDRWKRILPTLTVTQYRLDQIAAQA